MTRILIAVFAAMIAAPAFAEPPAKPADGKRGEFIANLTEEQRECIAAKNCPKPQRSGDDAAAQDDAARKAGIECMKKAFDECGIAMPERGPRPDGETPPPPPAE